MGYSESQIEDLIQNGEVMGMVDRTTGEVYMDQQHLSDLVLICNCHRGEIDLHEEQDLYDTDE